MVLIFFPVIYIASIPSSLKIPERVCANNAANSSADTPISLNAPEYLDKFSKNYPESLAPATNPSFIIYNAVSPDIPNCDIKPSTELRTSLNSFPNVRAVAAIPFLKDFNSFPVKFVNC
jgi:hypothetical protein